MLRSVLLLSSASLTSHHTSSWASLLRSAGSLNAYLQPQLCNAAAAAAPSPHNCLQTLHTTTQQQHQQSSREPDVDSLRQQLLDTALGHVKRHGWTHASLAAAAQDMLLSPSVVGMFSRGPSQLAEHFIAQQNEVLAQELQAAQQQYLALPLRQRITAAVRRRLELNTPYMDSWPQVKDCCVW